MGKLAATDRPCLRSLSHSFTLDFVLGAICSKSEAEEIYRKIETFLADVLKLKVSPTKSGLKHCTETIRFLGYDITARNTEKTVKMKVHGQQCKKRTCKSIIWLTIPEVKLKSFADRQKYGNWETLEAKHRANLTHASDAEILLQYSAEMRGIAQYYALAKNFASLGKLRILGVRSFLKTMASKHKKSVQQIATMLNRGEYLAVREKPQKGKTREYKLFRLKDVKREPIFKKNVDNLPTRSVVYAKGVDIQRRLEANRCEYCGKEGGYMECHHIRQLADIKKGTETWKRLMIARKRKTLVVCVDCHDKLHAGTLPDVRHNLK
jgi:Type II intron maturase